MIFHFNFFLIKLVLTNSLIYQKNINLFLKLNLFYILNKFVANTNDFTHK